MVCRVIFGVLALLTLSNRGFGVDEPNAANIYREAIKIAESEPAFIELAQVDPYCPHDAAMIARLEKCRHAFDLMEQAAKTSRCDWDLDNYPDLGLPFPEGLVMRMRAALFHEIRRAGDAKQYERVVAIASSGLVFSGRMQSMPLLLTRLTGFTIDDWVFEAISLYVPDLPHPLLAELLKTESQRPKLSSLVESIRFNGQVASRVIKTSPYWLSAELAANLRKDVNGNIRAIQANCEQQISFASIPVNLLPNVQPKLRELVEQLSPTLQAFAPRAFAAVDYECEFQSLRLLNHAALVVALDGPDKLNGLVDPFTGLPFRYAKLPHGFRVTGAYVPHGKKYPVHRIVGRDLFTEPEAPEIALAPKSSVSGAWNSSLPLVQLRARLKTNLIHPGPIVKSHAAPEKAANYRLGHYGAPLGKNWAYVSPDPNDGKKHPAVVWIPGGYSGIGAALTGAGPAENDQTPAVFRDAGFVVMIPSLRGQNDNPGKIEMFLGEVDDLLCAIVAISQVPYVDPNRIYLVGHSTGATNVMLAAASTTRVRAAFCLGGKADPCSNASGSDHADEPFDRANSDEVITRCAMNFVASLKTPTWAFCGSEGLAEVSLATERWAIASRSPFHALALTSPANHFNVIRPICKMLVSKLLADSGSTCAITIAPQEVANAFNLEFHPKIPAVCLSVRSPHIEVTPPAVEWLKVMLATQKASPERVYFRMVSAQGSTAIVFQETPVRGYRVSLDGVSLGVDETVAATLPDDVVIDVYTETSEKEKIKYQALMLVPKGKPASEGRKLMLLFDVSGR